MSHPHHHHTHTGTPLNQAPHLLPANWTRKDGVEDKLPAQRNFHRQLVRSPRKVRRGLQDRGGKGGAQGDVLWIGGTASMLLLRTAVGTAVHASTRGLRVDRRVRTAAATTSASFSRVGRAADPAATATSSGESCACPMRAQHWRTNSRAAQRAEDWVRGRGVKSGSERAQAPPVCAQAAQLGERPARPRERDTSQRLRTSSEGMPPPPETASTNPSLPTSPSPADPSKGCCRQLPRAC